ncbi:MAG: NUDIX hydrolase, partial [Patescibacteria group bacterium]
PAKLKLAYVLHKNIDDERLDLFFIAKDWTGHPKICEPSNCDYLKFSPLSALPKNTVAYIAQALNDIQKNIFYGEIGW